MQESYLFTSESVSHGHPDKVCDQISDMLLDYYIEKDSNVRTAIETMALANKVIVAGEINSEYDIVKDEIIHLVRNKIKQIGYEQRNFNWQTVDVDVLLNKQSVDIARGVDAQNKISEGAGDQGIMFGYACDHTDTFMPVAIHYAHKVLRDLFSYLNKMNIVGIGPDAKSQVTLRYVNGTADALESILVSVQHTENYTIEQLKYIIQQVIKSSFPAEWLDKGYKLYVNPTGRFVMGGPASDCGLTGRKIIVDTYGGYALHGGGAFSGKDSTKVDRSAAYMLRYLAKNVVAAGLAKECTIQTSYAIGMCDPMSFYVNTNNTGTINDCDIAHILKSVVELTPRAIREHLSLDQPIFTPTATYGHFGRNSDNNLFTWEKLDLAEKLTKEANNLTLVSAQV